MSKSNCNAHHPVIWGCIKGVEKIGNFQQLAIDNQGVPSSVRQISYNCVHLL